MRGRRGLHQGALDDGTKGCTELKPPIGKFGEREGGKEFGSRWKSVVEDRAKGGEVQIEVRGRLGGNVAHVGGSLFRAGEGVWFEVRGGREFSLLLRTCI